MFVQGLGDTSLVSVWETDNTADYGIVEVDRLSYVTQFYEKLKPEGLKSNLFLSGIHYVRHDAPIWRIMADEMCTNT